MKEKLNNYTVYSAAHTVLASLWERAGDKKSQGSSKHRRKEEDKGGETFLEKTSVQLRVTSLLRDTSLDEIVKPQPLTDTGSLPD